jgi:hypothetical protein
MVASPSASLRTNRCHARKSRCQEGGTGQSVFQSPSGVSRRVPVESQTHPSSGPENGHITKEASYGSYRFSNSGKLCG